MARQPLTDEIRAAIKAQLTAKPKASERSKHVERRSSAGLWARPFHSDALGVSPGQIAEAKEELRKHGLDVDFDKEGRCIITGPDQYRKVAKAVGLWDGAQGYGIPGQTTGREHVEAREEAKRKLIREHPEAFEGVKIKGFNC